MRLIFDCYALKGIGEQTISENLASRKFLKFIAVGIWNTAIGIASISILHNALPNTHELVILTMSSAIVIFQSHWIMRRYVWMSKNSYLSELVIFTIGYLPVFIANIAVVYIFVTILDNALLIVQLIFAGLSAVLLFLYQNFVTFKAWEK